MALTPSTMQPLGTVAPDFTLPECEGGNVSLSDFDGSSAYLIAFICNHCPYVKHLADALATLGRDYQAKGVTVLAINANDVANYPDDAPEKMVEEKKRRGYEFPYLFDGTQEVAKAYRAACTPDFYVFDRDRKLVYRGQFDASRPTRIAAGQYDPGTVPPTGADVRAALDAALAGQRAPEPQQPSIGCNIKWKAGQAPAYA